MTSNPSVATTDPSTDEPPAFEPYLPAVIQPASRPGRIERFLTRALRHR